MGTDTALVAAKLQSGGLVSEPGEAMLLARLLIEAPQMVELLKRFMRYEKRADLRVDVNRLLCRLERSRD